MEACPLKHHICTSDCATPIDKYRENRERFIKKIVNKTKYGDLKFSEDELRANELYEEKLASKFTSEFEEDFYYDLAMKYKEQIKNHTLFKDIYSMPKGVLHHHHMTSSLDVDLCNQFMVGNPNIYQREFPTSVYTPRLVYTTVPKAGDVPFQNVIDEWKQENPGKNTREFFTEKLRMSPEELAQAKNNQQCWDCFMPKYFFCLNVMQYEVFYRKHLVNLFQKCVDEKIYRLESRLTPGSIKDEKMVLISLEKEMNIYADCVQEIRQKEPNFSFGIIVEMIRSWKFDKIEATMRIAFDLKKKYPDLIIGMDLSGNEDAFAKFEQLAEVMLKAEDMKEEFRVEVPWILHCGESLNVKNQNLIDGHLLEAKRLGHALTLFKQSYLLEIFKKEKVCIEINPISHQTLKNVRDLRMHPAIGYLNMGLKVSINCDDPTLYNTEGVSYDYFVSMVGLQFDLLDIKLVILNNIECSQASKDLKKIYYKKFESEWKTFTENFLEKYE